MSDLSDIISNNKENILIGEIGALLHDIGKCHPDFIEKESKERIQGLPHHARDIDKLLKPELIDTLKKIKIKFNDEEKSVYDLIRYHHDAEGTLLTYLEKCDHLDSADDKGVVRRKQPKDITIIASPFGFPKEKIDLQCLQKRLNDLESNLIGLFQNYVSDSLDIVCFRKCLINNLKTTFSHALGETRIPANDVTLWDHSHSTASLFKSVLCAMVLGEKPDKDKLQWRIFGFCWDGIGFINKGKEVADILQRNNIIEGIKRKLENKFEEEIPIGNVIYEDNNGIYFTFPALNNNSEVLAEECAKIGLNIIRNDSNNEIWPFFTLSKPSRTLTILTEELKFASKERTIPKMTPTLFIEGNGEIALDNPEIDTPEDGRDICPICRLRAKSEDDDRCNICKKRKRGRLESWLSSRENTIWIDEVADDNNRIALLTLSFDLDKWLDGTIIGTIFSQTLEDWKNSTDAIKFFNNKQKIQKLKNRSIEINDTLINLSKNCLKIITDEDPSKDHAFKSELINTFYENVKSKQDKEDENYIEKFIDNLKVRVGPELFNSSNLQKVIFTQNPSPARLYRIWKETEEFFNLVIQDIKGEIYPYKWKRLHFFIDYNASKDKINLDALEYTPLIIKINGLKPESILVLHKSGGEFYTIESLGKFKFNDKSGADAVKDALSKRIDWIAKEDEPDINLLKNGQNIEINGMPSEEDYYPFIEITKSPLSMRLIVPASDSISILGSIVKLYNQRFEKVLGKLPLNIGLLVSKRKFPLYVLLDTGERLFYAKEFKKPEMMDAWWDINDLRNDEFYGFYPVTKFEDQKYNLDDLVPLSKGKIYSLYPGYFDFDLILGTQDRYNITYNEKRRANKDYILFSKRPYYFYQFPQMIDLWEILGNNISNSQINFIEELLTNKLQEWRNVNEPIKNEVFRKFVEATIKDAFSSNWNKLRKETQDFILNSVFNGSLLDTIVLFSRTIKGGG
ncbi:MAG TPA: CRISPR-associated protein Csx11 [Dictyoglomaceae bacterium]|nr:CRISPR-associated protein Csx11 [Dictyoglomaceae bacterium]HPU44046.1 CRISPR-associated protein Csx11 [Dictyoglomaceae bacterium]